MNRRSLILFRDTILPAIDLPDNIDPIRAAARGPHDRADHSLKDWQRAAMRLIESLPSGNRQGDVPEPDWNSFKPYLDRPGTPAYTVRGGRITWRIAPFLDWDSLTPTAFLYLGDEADDPLGVVLGDLHGIERRLLRLSVDDLPLWDALLLLAPILADAEPSLALRLLDLETYRKRVLDDREITPEVRQARLKRIDFPFRRNLIRARLHAIGGLANNRFGELPGLLIHPVLQDTYSQSKPYIVFAVLYGKVSILHELAGGCSAPEHA